MNILRRILSASLAIVLVAVAAAPLRGGGQGEHVAVLYATDGLQLYTITPHNGELNLLGTLKADGPPLTEALPLVSMVYDGQMQRLYLNAIYFNSYDYSSQDILYRIAPGTLEITNGLGAWGGLLDGPPCALSYDWKNSRLCTSRTSSGTWTPVLSINPITGEQTTVTSGRNISGWPRQSPFFDADGHFWMFQQNDAFAVLREFSLAGEGQILSVLNGTVYDGNYFDGTWPRYQSFSFDQRTGALWATFVRTDNGYLWGDYYTHLCTVDLKTGQPKKIIAAYPSPNVSLKIAWGLGGY